MLLETSVGRDCPYLSSSFLAASAILVSVVVAPAPARGAYFFFSLRMRSFKYSRTNFETGLPLDLAKNSRSCLVCSSIISCVRCNIHYKPYYTIMILSSLRCCEEFWRKLFSEPCKLRAFFIWDYFTC